MNRRKGRNGKEKLWEIEKDGGETGRKKGRKRQKRDIYKKLKKEGGGKEARKRRKKGELKRRKKRGRKKQLKRDRDVKQRHVL